MAKTSKQIEEVYVGKEPVFVGLMDDRIQMLQTFNWYNYMYTVEEGKDMLLTYLKKQSYAGVDTIRKLSGQKIVPTACWMARMMTNGTVFLKDDMVSFNNLLAGMESLVKRNAEETAEKVVVDVQAKLRETADRYIGEMEEQLDAVLRGDSFSGYSFFQSNGISANVVRLIKNHFFKSYTEILSDDEQVKEAYGKSITKWKRFYKGLMDDCDRYVGNKKAAAPRKPRKKKEKSAGSVVKALKFQKEFKDLKIVSINPADIIGCLTLWVYNTKYKKLGVYHASGPKGLSVKGTTLVGFDEDSSIVKALRKPESVIKEVLSAGKVAQKKIMSNLKTAEYKGTGRINSDTILLRATK